MYSCKLCELCELSASLIRLEDDYLNHCIFFIIMPEGPGPVRGISQIAKHWAQNDFLCRNCYSEENYPYPIRISNLHELNFL